MEEGVSVMTNVISSLTTEMSADKLWAAFGPVVPLIAVVTLFSLGMYFVRRATKKAGKGRAGA